MKRTLVPLALLILAAAAPAAAQAVDPCPEVAIAADTAGPGRQPDVLISASARAREVRFRQQPRVTVRLIGCAALDTVRVRERRNLPDPVQPGVTYRDVFVAVDVLGFVDAQCLLRQLQRSGEAGGAAACPWTVRDSAAAPQTGRGP